MHLFSVPKAAISRLLGDLKRIFAIFRLQQKPMAAIIVESDRGIRTAIYYSPEQVHSYGVEPEGMLERKEVFCGLFLY